MNKTLLLILCDFLLLNLLALTRWEKAEPAASKRPPVPEMAANAATKDQDLVAAMKQSLADEQSTRDQLAQKLATTESTLSTREQTLAEAQAEKQKLASTLTVTQRQADELNQKVAAAAQESSMTKEQLARLQRELEAKQAEAARQAKSIAALEQQQGEARQKIEGLTVAVKVAEQEKVLLKETADTFKQQAVAERQEREKVQATTTQLAQGVGQLAQNSGALTKEIRDNRPINANILYNDYLANRVHTIFTVHRQAFIGSGDKTKETETVFVADGGQVYALLHVAETPFSLPLGDQQGVDWEKVSVEFSRPPDYRAPAAKISFLSIDPRIVVVPVDPAQANAIGVKVYQTALDTFKFPEAVLISAKGYGEVGFKLDASQPGFVRVDNRLFKRIFGDFAPSRGDLVLSKTGELLGIMVNSDYCALVNNFLPARSITTGDQKEAATGTLFDDLGARLRALPSKLQ